GGAFGVCADQRELRASVGFAQRRDQRELEVIERPEGPLAPSLFGDPGRMFVGAVEQADEFRLRCAVELFQGVCHFLLPDESGCRVKWVFAPPVAGRVYGGGGPDRGALRPTGGEPPPAGPASVAPHPTAPRPRAPPAPRCPAPGA